MVILLSNHEHAGKTGYDKIIMCARGRNAQPRVISADICGSHREADVEMWIFPVGAYSMFFLAFISKKTPAVQHLTDETTK